MKKTAENVDKAMKTTGAIEEENVIFYNVRKEPFEIYGLYDSKNQEYFKRMPDEIAKNTNEGVAVLYTNTAGGRVRFSTDSQYVAIRAVMPTMAKMSHFSLTGSCGFDLYVDEENGSTDFCGVFKPPFSAVGGFESKLKFETKRKRYFTLNFPTYSDVKDLYIGIDANASLEEGLKYSYHKPIIFYGSSITQGGCSSRPGNTYESIITQRMNVDHINLGFSGSGKGEEIIAKYIASLPMSGFVLDYDYNSPSPEHLKETHYIFYKTVRNANPKVPIIIMSKCDFRADRPEDVQRKNIIVDTYKKALKDGDKNVYFIDGETIFNGDFKNACTVDGIHPNDLGFALMANAIESVLKKAISFL